MCVCVKKKKRKKDKGKGKEGGKEACSVACYDHRSVMTRVLPMSHYSHNKQTWPPSDDVLLRISKECTECTVAAALVALAVTEERLLNKTITLHYHEPRPQPRHLSF